MIESAVKNQHENMSVSNCFCNYTESNDKNIKFADFCSGIGGGRLGLEMSGMRCVIHSEINSDSDYTYKIFFGDEINLGDLTKIREDCIKGVDVLIAGFPCQTFSIVGKRAGFEDSRGQIIFYLSKILKHSNIPYFIFENVKGLVNHNSGRTLNNIITLLEKNGYIVKNKILSSADFGVPQLRERVYFVGIRKDLYYKPFCFPCGTKKSDIKEFLMDVNNDFLDINHPTFQRYINNKYNKGRIDINKILERNYMIIDTRQSDLRLYDHVCPTLRTGRHGILYVRDKKMIKLSGQEALLLQGFPKNIAYKARCVADRLLLSQAGNAMTVNVIKAIGESLHQYIDGGK